MMLASELQTACELKSSMRKVQNNFRFYIVLDVKQIPQKGPDHLKLKGPRPDMHKKKKPDPALL